MAVRITWLRAAPVSIAAQIEPIGGLVYFSHAAIFPESVQGDAKTECKRCPPRSKSKHMVRLHPTIPADTSKSVWAFGSRSSHNRPPAVTTASQHEGQEKLQTFSGGPWWLPTPLWKHAERCGPRVVLLHYAEGYRASISILLSSSTVTGRWAHFTNLAKPAYIYQRDGLPVGAVFFAQDHKSGYGGFFSFLIFLFSVWGHMQLDSNVIARLRLDCSISGWNK